MTEEEMRREMRLLPIEFLLTSLYKNFYRSIGANGAIVAHEHSRQLTALSAQPWGVEAALSDMLSNEFRSAVASLLTIIEAKMKEP